MRRPDYISTEQTRFQPTTIEKIESKVGFAVRKKMDAQSLFMDRESQIAAIEKTFEASEDHFCRTAVIINIKRCKYMFYCFQDSKLPIEEHYSKKGVHPVEVYDILPDDEMWKYPCAQVSFNHMESFSYPEQFL